jgi:hypothetical protein
LGAFLCHPVQVRVVACRVAVVVVTAVRVLLL